MFFAQSLGGAVFVCIGQSVFVSDLAKNLIKVAGLDVPTIIAAGATELNKVVPVDKLAEVLVVYNDSLKNAFIVAVVVASSMVLPSLGMEWRSIKKDNINIPAS